ncbi:hypothetical protein ACFRU3_23085 [Streptomyces sp. NPDC056910]|uniref:hypothetical protein n=1 Tax=Streptomyces sp. NPDC056910 TaxID=3345964 RepID=UPI0036802D13
MALILIERLKEPVFGFPYLTPQVLEGVDAPGGGDDLALAPIGGMSRRSTKPAVTRSSIR